MNLTEVKATKEIGGEKKEITCMIDLGDSIEDATERFGGEVVFSNFKRAATITAQAAMRRFMEQGLGDNQVADKMGSWRPGVALERTVDPVAALKAKFAKMSPEERAALLAELGA